MRRILVVAGAACSLRLAAAEPSDTARATLPGEYPEHRFHSPFPAPPKTAEDKFADKYLLGDWWGGRSELAAWGIYFNMLVIADPFVNVLGGKRRGFAGYNFVAAGLTLESEPLVGFPGGQLHAGFGVNFGSSLSRNFIGNSFSVQLADSADEHIRFTYLAYTQSLVDDVLTLRIGRLTINSVYGEEFLGSEYFKAFSSIGIDNVPEGFFFLVPGAFGYPETTWGARAKVEPVEWLYVMGGAYNGDPDVKLGTHHGLDFSLDGPLFLIGEVGVRRNYGKHSTGLASNLKVGAAYDGGRYGLYLIADHELARFGNPDAGRQLGAFAAITVTPDWDASPLPLFVDAGLVLSGPASSRPKDFVGLAVAYGTYSTVDHDFEITLEATYGLRLRPGFVLAPDVQYIIHPGGTSATSNALAVGLNAVITP